MRQRSLQGLPAGRRSRVRRRRTQPFCARSQSFLFEVQLAHGLERGIVPVSPRNAGWPDTPVAERQPRSIDGHGPLGLRAQKSLAQVNQVVASLLKLVGSIWHVRQGGHDLLDRANVLREGPLVQQGVSQLAQLRHEHIHRAWIVYVLGGIRLGLGVAVRPPERVLDRGKGLRRLRLRHLCRFGVRVSALRARAGRSHADAADEAAVKRERRHGREGEGIRRARHSLQRLRHSPLQPRWLRT
mmetsp:Transcript_95317/g.266913  ORF Transcript_95317/g.266913 Transcript_95317/m.266913 type:complete len:242 (+) Transcript_95317:135-860(+)